MLGRALVRRPAPAEDVWLPCAVYVVEGKVAQVHPRFIGESRRWLRTPANEVWPYLNRKDRRWWPDVVPYRPTGDTSARRVRRWWRDHEVAAKETELTLGRTGDGGWFVHETSQAGQGWRFPDFPSALAECAARLLDGQWRRVPANYGPDRQAVEDEPLQAELWEQRGNGEAQQ